MRKRIKKVCKRVIFLLLALTIFFGLSEGMKNISRTSLTSIKGFYTEQKNSLDVVLIGASQVYSDYSPTEAWKKYGFTSYCFASEGVPGSMYKSMLKEVLRRQNPKVVVFEINGFLYEEEYLNRSGSLHKYIDSLALSTNWVETIRENVSKEEQSSFFFPISTYHDNWKHPKEMLATLASRALLGVHHRSNLKGISTLSLTRNCDQEPGIDDRIQLTDKARDYLEELCKTCQEEGVQNVLFVRFPHLRTVGDANVYPQIEKIVNSYGYDFLNWTDYTQFGLDKDAEYYDVDHLNNFGMRKFTPFFAEYLTQNYDLSSEHSAKLKSEWDKSAQEADSIFAQCDEDLASGVGRRYTEIAVYRKPEIISQAEAGGECH